jgi:hypothetical protein
MIDLAGSEAFDYKTDGPVRGINAGLVALGRVLMAMSDKAVPAHRSNAHAVRARTSPRPFAAFSARALRVQAHVPYRDSVVTQLLSDVLGAEKPCLTEMLCCLSPASKHWHETKCVHSAPAQPDTTPPLAHALCRVGCDVLLLL